MSSDLFTYDLPPGRIAQRPVEPRDAARLLVAGPDGAVDHRRVHDLPDLLRAGDLVVLNRTRVIRARLAARKSTGGRLEVLLIHPVEADGPPRWHALVRGSVRTGVIIEVAGTPVTIETTANDDGTRVLCFPDDTDVLALIERHGRIPLPPYIDREDDAGDADRYQTVFGDRPGSVAAPTAALHLTGDLLDRLAARGVASSLVDLTIGPGTFRPVTVQRLADHRMHREFCTCPAETVTAVRACRARGGRVVAVGTTVVRTLETAWRQPGGFDAYAGWTDLFLHPPDTIASVDLLLTNFHLPRSTLLMLVACLTGIERLHQLYHEAITTGYRFYSYGDALLVGPMAPPPVTAPPSAG